MVPVKVGGGAGGECIWNTVICCLSAGLKYIHLENALILMFV